MAATRTSSVWDRYAWVAGIVFVAALVAEAVISVGIPLNQDDSPAKIATELHRHDTRLVVVACLSAVYAPMFLVYLVRLHDLLRSEEGSPRFLGSLVLTGGVLFVAMHAVSDVGIYGMLGAKVASFGAEHDHGVSYTLYLVTFAIDSVGDVFASLFMLAAGRLLLTARLLPRWLGWVAIAAGILFFLQAFGLGGVIATFGLVLDLVAFLLFLVFVLASSVVRFVRERPAPGLA